MENAGKIGIAIAVVLVVAALAGNKTDFFSAYSPDTSPDLIYKHAPTVYFDSKSGGYSQIYPPDLNIGTEFTLPNNQIPFDSPIRMNQYLTIKKVLG